MIIADIYQIVKYPSLSPINKKEKKS